MLSPLDRDRLPALAKKQKELISQLYFVVPPGLEPGLF